MVRAVLIIVWLCSVSLSLYAGVDKEYGKKVAWWTPYYNQFLSYLGLEKSYALVVGVGTYDDSSFSSLPSEKDAIRIKDYLINEAGFDHVRLITGDQVDINKIRILMVDHYPSLLTKKDRFLFYWSGHGVTTGQSTRKLGYLAVKKSKNYHFASMVSMRDISEWDYRLQAKQTLYLLDACFSGIAASKAMSVNQEQTLERVNRPSRQILTAGLENQQTIAINDINGGLFTRALLDGLRGQADTDKGAFKKDGVVTVRELEEYVRTRVDHERRRVHWKQPITPVLYNFSQYEGDYFFVSDKRIVKEYALNWDNQPIAEGVIATGVSLEPEMILIKGGISSIGCLSGIECGSDHIKPTEVKVNDFLIGKFEVTFDEWNRCVSDGVCKKINAFNYKNGNQGRLPVATVSWADVMKYVTWINEKTGKNFRLPTEAEWEYAARAGGKTKYPGGNSIDCSKYNVAACFKGSDSAARSVNVGSYLPNNYDLYDMYGNVWEWTCSKPNAIQKCASSHYLGERVFKGGSFDAPSNVGLDGRMSADASSHLPDFLGVGFRLLHNSQ